MKNTIKQKIVFLAFVLVGFMGLVRPSYTLAAPISLVPPVSSGILNTIQNSSIKASPNFSVPTVPKSKENKPSLNERKVFVKKIHLWLLRRRHMTDQKSAFEKAYGKRKWAIIEQKIRQNEGKTLTSYQIEQIAKDMTTVIHRGTDFFLDRAFIPEQIVHNGVLDVDIQEVTIGEKPKIQCKKDENNNERHSCLQKKEKDDHDIQEIISRYNKPNDHLTIREIDHSVMLVDILVGSKTSTQALVVPGQVADTSDIIYTYEPRDRFDNSSIYVDDWGSPYTGAERLTVAPEINNVFTLGDTLNLTASVSGNIEIPGQGPGMEYGAVGYTAPVGSYGTKIGFMATELNYNVLGANIPAEGHASIFDAQISQPLVLHTDYSLFGQIDAQYYMLDDILGGPTGLNDLRNIPDVVVMFNGQSNFFQPFIHTNDFSNRFVYMVQVTGGSVDFANSVAQQADAHSLNTQGMFYKADVELSDYQVLPFDTKNDVVLGKGGDNNKIYEEFLTFNFYGQIASKNLDPSQQIVMGGPMTIPAYAEGIFDGSQGGYVQLAWNRYLYTDIDTTFYGNLFYDAGYIDVDRFVVLSGNNTAIMSGPGIGFNFDRKLHFDANEDHDLFATVSFSIPVGPTPSIVTNTIPGAFNFNSNPSGLQYQTWVQAGIKW